MVELLRTASADGAGQKWPDVIDVLFKGPPGMFAEKRSRISELNGPLEDAAYLKTDRLPSILFNVLTSILLLTVSAPFFLIIPILIFLLDGRPIFYKGERLGKNKKPYYMYKFRTLVKGADKLLGADLLTPKHRLETVTGKFLRETRLDELPQLINVVRGEMNLVGPRPERWAVYENLCKHLRNYDKRFEVKPGIIGYSQLFTPHSAPKRVRSILDNRYINEKQKWWIDIFFFALAVLWLVKRAAWVVLKKGWELAVRTFKKSAFVHQSRDSERLTPPSTEVWFRIHGEGGEYRCAGEIDDICDEGLAFFWPEDLSGKKLDLTLRIAGHFPPRWGIKRKTVRCFGDVIRVWRVGEGNRRHVVLYKVRSSLDLLISHQYFLAKSIV